MPQVLIWHVWLELGRGCLAELSGSIFHFYSGWLCTLWSSCR